MNTQPEAPADGVLRLTAEQLNRRIAELCGYKVEKLVSLCRLHKPNGHTVTTACGLTADAWQVFADELPQYLTDANAALELLEELQHKYTIGLFAEGDMQLLTVNKQRRPARTWEELFAGPFFVPPLLFKVIGKDWKETVCLAWYQAETGQRVTLCSESEPNPL